MDSKNEPLEVKFTEECIEEITEIYEYISNNLKVNNAAKRLIWILLHTEELESLWNLMKNGKDYFRIEPLR